MASVSPHRSVHHGAFGNDGFGVLAERFARFFGTPSFSIGQTVIVVLWIAANAAAFSFRWDPYLCTYVRWPTLAAARCVGRG